MATLARTEDDLSPEWFTAVLRDAGHLRDERVTEASVEVAGTGQLGSMVRAKLSYDDSSADAPRSVMVKLASTDERSRAMGVRTGTYEVEVRFYQEIAPTVGMSLARCDFAAFDREQGWVTLVLEDLSDRAQPGDVMQGGTVDQAAGALHELVGLQAAHWDDPELEKHAWLADPARTQALFDEVPDQFEAVLERFGDKLDDEHVALIEQVAPLASKWIRAWSEPRVVQHGDYRLDNMLLGTKPDVPAITVIDWQTVRLGPPTIDASYYMGVCLEPEERRRCERDLVADYHAALVSAGVQDWSWEDCWLEYRAQSIFGLYMALGFATQVKQTERGDAMFASATRAYADLALDHEAADLLER